MLLSEIAATQPHAAFASLMHGLSEMWTFLSRTVPNIQSHIIKLDQVISTHLIPVLTGRPPPNETQGDIFALPARMGGLGIRKPSTMVSSEFEASVICSPIVDQVVQGYTYECEVAQAVMKQEVQSERVSRDKQNLQRISASVVDPLEKKALQLAGEKGASSWLTVLPLSEFGFVLHKMLWLCDTAGSRMISLQIVLVGTSSQ